MSEFRWNPNDRDQGDGFDFKFPPPQKLFPMAWGAALVAVLAWAVVSAYYTVEANEEAVVLRLGKLHGVSGPGFHGKLPFGIDKVFKGEVKTVHRAEFGYRTISAGVKSQFDYASSHVVAEATMLTGDLNMAMVNWEVRYKIRDLTDYLFEVRNPIETLRAVSEAVMRTEVGDRSVDEVLTLDRTAIGEVVGEKMQAKLDSFRCGIHIVKVNLKRVDPPDAVRSSFNRVNQAIQIRDRIINEAEGMRNKKIPAARGAKEQAIKEAEGYRIGRVNRAKGDAERFLSVLAEYKKAEDVTRRRLYLESMAQLLPKIGEITLMDSKEAGLFKMLNLDRGKGGGQ